MTHRTNARFWRIYRQLPTQIQNLANKNFDLLKRNPRHPSLHFKKIGVLWSVRVGIDYRAIGLDKGETVLWIWIGTHDEYKRMVAQQR